MRPAGTTTAYTRARKSMCARLEGSPQGAPCSLHVHSAKIWIVSKRKHRPQNNGQCKEQRYSHLLLLNTSLYCLKLKEESERMGVLLLRCAHKEFISGNSGDPQLPEKMQVGVGGETSRGVIQS